MANLVQTSATSPDSVLRGRPERIYVIVLLAGTAMLAFSILFCLGLLAASFYYDGQAAAWIDIFMIVLASAGAITVMICIWYDIVFARSWQFRLDASELTVHYGFLWDTDRAIPRSRVHYTDIASTPLHRYFGVVNLALFTPGSPRPAAVVPCITPEMAATLRTALDTDPAAPAR
ncbi:MAG: PH domain-containing protein [Pseudomonadota bacterium]